MEKQTVNIALIQSFIDRYGLAELEKRSGVSVHTILRVKNKIRPTVPKLAKTRIRLADALGVSEQSLFPKTAS